jgi:predicted ATP-dependent serine protease
MANKPSLTDIFSAMTANETIEAAKVQKNPKKLWKEFWIENEVCCLFADANVGKSILAVQISNAIADKLGKNEHILYYDFELSKKQFELRYTDEQNKSTFKFNDKFIRVELDVDKLNEYCKATNTSFDEVVINGIEANIQKYNSKILIVDNISWLTNMKDTATTAGKLMSQLCNLKKRYGASILVLAHTPKRNLGSPLTQNSLSGSKKFTNFFDAMFAVGKSIKDPSVRYVKQIKVRTGAFKYDANNVELCTIEKRGSFLGFTHLGYSSEEEQLKVSKKTVKAVSKALNNKRGRKSKRVGRSHLAAAQIDLVSQMADEAFEMFSKS